MAILAGFGVANILYEGGIRVPAIIRYQFWLNLGQLPMFRSLQRISLLH